MNQKAWDEIEKLYDLPHVPKSTIDAFRMLKSREPSHTKGEGALRHYCSFFLPYDKEQGKIYLGHHKKAGDWIPPGGHIDPGETPSDAAIREMQEELKTEITLADLTAWNLSVKEINKEVQGCQAHYDVWHLVNLKEQPFDFLRKEYHDAGWFSITEGVAKIAKNPDFAKIITQLFS